MATYYWTDAGTDLTVLTGWTTGRDGTGTNPGSINNATSVTDTFIIERGDRDLTCKSSFRAAAFRVTSGSRNRIGNAGEAAQIRATDMQFQGGGTSYIDVSNNGATSVGTCNIEAVSTGGSLLSISSSHATTVAQLDVGPNARVQVSSNVTVTAANNAGGNLTLQGTSVTNGAPAVTTLISTGTTNLSRQVTTIDVISGTTTDFSPPLTGGSATAITTLRVATGGSYVDQNGKDITTATIYSGGTYDGSGVTGNKTIATLNRWANSTVVLRGQGGVVSVTTENGIGLP